MKLTIELELDESWEAYYTNNEERLKNLIRHDLEGVKATIIESNK